jgi:small-conductance mechanosensitive channel/CRP-like cAMP-binding protein
MSLWGGILAEAIDDHSLYLALGLLVTIVLVRIAAPEEKRRLFGLTVLSVLHLLLVPVAGGLRGLGNIAYRDVRLAALIFAAMAIVGMSGTVLFAVLLPRIRLRTPRILRDVIGAVASIIAIFALASRAGFNLSGLIATSAVLTAVIGFSLQDTLGNIMGGLALQLDNSIKVGDWIKLGDLNGRVVDIRWRYTSVETRNWETVVVPNSFLMKGQVVVVGRRIGQPEYWRRWVWFNVDFRYSPSEVISTVMDALTASPIERVAEEPKPNCVLMDLHESYGRYAVRYYLTDIAVDDPTDSTVRARIYFSLKRVGIPLSIPAHAVFMTEDSTERRAAKGREDWAHRMDALAHVELFGCLGEADRETLAQSLRHAPFTAGEVMTKQGAEAHWLYLIVSGEASVRVTTDAGLQREVARLKAGEIFGEMSLMTGERRAATVVAVVDSECYRLDKEAFQSLVTARPELAEHVAEVLAKRRVELLAVKENLDAEAKAKKLAAAKNDLLGRIRDFFGLEEGQRSATN